MIAVAYALILLAPVASARPLPDFDADGTVDVAARVLGFGKVTASARVAVAVQYREPTITLDALPAVGTGVVTLTGRADPGVALGGFVDLWIDGRSWGRASGLDPWSFPLDTARLTDGPHKVWVSVISTYGVVGIGRASATATLVTQNGVGELIFSRELTLTAANREDLEKHPLDTLLNEHRADAGSDMIRIKKDYASLRITFHAVDGFVKGEGSWAIYEDDTQRPGAAILLPVAAVDAASEGGAVRSPAIVALSWAFAGMGKVRITVEGVPAVAS